MMINKLTPPSPQHLSPLLSALSTHTPPLTPPPSPLFPLTILIPLPPPTAASRHASAASTKKPLETALFALREARGMMRKRLRGMALGRVVGPDEMRRAEAELERRNEGGVGEVRGLVEGVRRRVLEG